VLAILLLVAVGGFYLFMMRNQRAKQRAQKEQMNDLQPGVKVMTRAGMIAHVDSVDDGEVILVGEDGQRMRFVREAIGKIFPNESEIEEAADDSPAAIEAAEEPSEHGIEHEAEGHPTKTE
jgi:preprotein translocase YajC subunit